VTLEARAEAVWTAGLGWLERNREGFAIPAGQPPQLFRLKALGELAAIAEVLWRRGDQDAGTRGRLHALLEFAWTQLGEGEVLARFLAERPYPVLGTTYSVFERMGWRHEPTRERLCELGQPGALAAARQAAPASTTEPVAAQYGTDGVAVLCLGLALAWEVLRLPSPWQRGRLYPNTWLAKRPAAAELSVPEAYSLTHAVFFMTDWGADPQGLPAAERAFLGENAPRWMTAFRAQAHFDLYAELAAALCCAGQAVPMEAEAVLRGAQQPDGAVPGPAERVAERTRGIEDPEHRRFVSAYHTTLAATLASYALTVGLFRAGVPAASAPGA
jgi:hypothetical protein